MLVPSNSGMLLRNVPVLTLTVLNVYCLICTLCVIAIVMCCYVIVDG